MPPSETLAPPARLWLIRHGQTDWNAAGRIQGQTPTLLNAQGRREAAELAAILARSPRRFAACYASDLPRAAETAQILADRLGNSVQLVPALRERNFGPIEGALPHEIRAARLAAGMPPSADLADWTGMPGIETNDQLWQRTSTALHELGDRHPDQDVLVVTHGGVMARALFRTLGILDGTPRRFPLANGMLAIFEVHPAALHLATLADMFLLAGEPPAPDTATMPPPG